MSRETARGLLGCLPRWARSPLVLTIPLLLVALPVTVSVLRDSSFDTTLEVFRYLPKDMASPAGPPVPALVPSPGFEAGLQGWSAGRGAMVARTVSTAHSGAASLAIVPRGRLRPDGALAATPVLLPRAARYRVRAWVRLPRVYRGGAPRIVLTGVAGAEIRGEHPGDPQARGRWQEVWTDVEARGRDLRGTILLRAATPLPQRDQAIWLDDVEVLSADPGVPVAPGLNLVSNPGLEYDFAGWGDPPAFAAGRTGALSHTGGGSLRSVADGPAVTDTNAGYTNITFPRAGTYRAQAWVSVPSADAGRPIVSLEGFSASRQLSQQTVSARRGIWQRVSTLYAISSLDLEGSLVLRIGPSSKQATARRAAGTEAIAFWDDISVEAPGPQSAREAADLADRVRGALVEPQMRLDTALIAGDPALYDPKRARVTRSARKNVVSFLVRVRGSSPEQARELAVPLRTALNRAAQRDALRQAAETWQRLVRSLERDLLPSQRALLLRRAGFVTRQIGAPPADAVAPPAPVYPLTAADRLRQSRLQRDRRRVIARIGENLVPRQRALVQQRVDDLERAVAAQTVSFVVMGTNDEARPRRWMDRTLDGLPGAYPPRIRPVWAAVSGLACSLLLFGLLVATTAVRDGVLRRR